MKEREASFVIRDASLYCGAAAICGCRSSEANSCVASVIRVVSGKCFDGGERSVGAPQRQSPRPPLDLMKTTGPTACTAMSPRGAPSCCVAREEEKARGWPTRRPG